MSFTTSEQTLQAILSQLNVVVKKNDELTQKVGELQGTVNKLTDQSAEVERLKHNLQKVSQELDAARGQPSSSDQKDDKVVPTAGPAFKQAAVATLALTPQKKDAKLALEATPASLSQPVVVIPRVAKREATGLKRQLSPEDGSTQERLAKQSPSPDTKRKGKAVNLSDEPPPKRLKPEPTLSPSSPTTRVSSRTRTRSKRLMVSENAMLEEKPPTSSPAPRTRGKASPASSHKEERVSPGPSSSKATLDSQAMGKGKPKKATVKKIEGEALKLNDDAIERYLQDLVAFPISSPIELHFSLDALNKAYGSITQGLLWEPKGKPYKWLFPGFETNPMMPTAPGEPGLLLCGRTEVIRDTWTLFVKDRDSVKKRWNYVGEYQGEVIGMMSATEFQALSDTAKSTWGAKIADHKKHLPYCQMRARITLRKRGAEITTDSLAEEVKKIKATPKKGGAISKADVIRAFESGEEAIPIVRMICVQYNAAFAQEVAAKTGTYK